MLRPLARNYTQMPLLLMGLAGWYGLFGLGSLLLALFPWAGFRVDGEAMNFASFWSQGYGLLAVIVGLLLCGITLGLLLRRGGARWPAAFCFFFLPVFKLADQGGAAREEFVAPTLAAGIACAGIYWYLFHTRGVRRYFGEPAIPHEPAAPSTPP